MKKVKTTINKVISKWGYKVVSLKSVGAKPKRQINLDLKGKASAPFNSVPFAAETLEFLVKKYEFKTVLDIGSGEGRHSDVLNLVGKNVTSIDFGTSVYFDKKSDSHLCVTADYNTFDFKEKFDAIWASHVLEHQPNPNLFLKKIHNDLKEGGILALTVPPLKHDIVGGHVTLWNAGLLMYQLILAGFNCRDICIKSYGYNISIVLKKKSISSYPVLSYDSGDILKLAAYFPEGTTEPFNGGIAELNWE